MTSSKLADIIEKGGHKIERRVTEEFRGWCAVCSQEVTYWGPSILEARHVLSNHIKRHEAPYLRDR